MKRRQKFEGITLPTDGGFRVAVWAVKDARLAYQSAQVFAGRERARNAASEAAQLLEDGTDLPTIAAAMALLANAPIAALPAGGAA